MTSATSVSAPPRGRRLTLGRAVAVGCAAGVIIVAVAVLLPERSQPLAEPPPRPSAQLSIDTLPPSRQAATAPVPMRLAEAAPAAPPLTEAAPVPRRPAEPPAAASPTATPATQPAAPAKAPDAEADASQPPDRRFLGGAMVAPLDSAWEPVDGNLGCPDSAKGSVMEMLCRLNAQGLTREYQLRLMEQEARRAELLARRAQAEKQRREAEVRKPQVELPPVDGRPVAAPAQRSGPTVLAVRGQGGGWTATLRLADGTSVPVRQGQDVPGGLRVQRIDRDGVVVRGPGGERRLDFSIAPDADAALLPRLGSDKGP